AVLTASKTRVRTTAVVRRRRSLKCSSVAPRASLRDSSMKSRTRRAKNMPRLSRRARTKRLSLRHDEVAVSELVPEGALLERLAVRLRYQVVPGDRPQQLQMGRFRLVPAGEEAVDGVGTAVGSQDEVRPALAGGDGAVRLGHRLERADDGRSHCDHAAVPC